MSEVERRQVVVVGSGFGGSVSACRLAQAGLDVLVLERGRWYGRGDFPRAATDGWRWEPDQGPFDVHDDHDLTIVRAAGVGGGSLLYSNVHLRLPDDGFGRPWPASLTREALDPYYDLVSAMLDLRPIDAGYWPIPTRTDLLSEAAGELGSAADVVRPPLAVNFGDPTRVIRNRFGAEQSGCRHCGKCSVGCNHGAKNSLDKNYLPWAMRHGAQVRARCEAVELEALPDGGYRLTVLDHVDGRRSTIDADVLVLAAGAVGTTRLLLEHGHALGVVSERVGERYSANGDVVTVSHGLDEEWSPTRGPAITAGVVVRDRYWYLVEDGGVPPLSVRDRGVTSDRWDEPLPVEPAFPIVDHAAILLGMGREPAAGTLRQDPASGIAVDWPRAANQSYYDLVVDYQEALGRVLGADGQLKVGKPVTVHSLGGAVMADDPEHGVVDEFGEVFGAPGLFVLDGAAIPNATGVNPSHTIAAVAERNAERLARRLAGDDEWQAPERASAPSCPDALLPR